MAQLVGHLVWDQDAAGSNPVTSTWTSTETGKGREKMNDKMRRSKFGKVMAWILAFTMTFSVNGFGMTYAQTNSRKTATGSDALSVDAEDGSFSDGTVIDDTEATDSDASLSDAEIKNDSAFHAEETVDGIRILVDAPEGVFPKGAVLSAEKITEAGKLSDIREGISETKKKEGEAAPEISDSVTFDISILDTDGNEIEPDTSKGKVSVRFEEVSGTGLEVWHSPDEGQAEKMDTEVTKNKTDGKAAIAFEAETFSAYTIMQNTPESSDPFTVTGGVEGTDYNYTDETVGGTTYKVLHIQSSTPLTISGGTSGSPITTARIEIAAGVSADVTIKDLYMECSWDSPFKIADNSTGNVNITLAEYNMLTSTSTDGAGLQKNGDSVGIGNLTIAGSGLLLATGGSKAAGIGGGNGGSGSNITISGGAVSACGGAAGLGGGYDGSGSNITISGGYVLALGGTANGAAAAGIGGGYGGSGSNITISEGTVVAYGGAAGIGDGYGGSGSNITISGGSVDASEISGIPRNATDSNAKPVYLATLTVRDSSRKLVQGEGILSLRNGDDTALSYGTKDMLTDDAGKLYVYLPSSTEIGFIIDEAHKKYACTDGSKKITVDASGTVTGTFVSTARTSGNSSGGSGESYTPQWNQNGNNWTYRKADGKYAQNEWQQLSFSGETSWYYFGSDSSMVSGWYKDNTGNWYYLKESSGTTGAGTGSGGGSYKGAMQTGWITDPQDGHKYYLDPSTGKMATGWNEIDGRWYYFNETVPGQSGWTWNEEEKKWNYTDIGQMPLGTCIESMTTDQKPE